MGSKPPKFRCTDSSKTCVRAIAAGSSLLGFRAPQQNATFTPIRDHLGNVGLEKQGTLMPMRNTLAATFFLASAAFAGTVPARAQTTDVRFVLDFLL
jgi:hypothetical protein